MCCSMLQCVAVCCSALQYTAAHCNTLRHATAHCRTLQHIQHTATCHLMSSTCVAVCCSALQYTAANCNTLQHTTAHYGTLQHTATHTTHSNIPLSELNNCGVNVLRVRHASMVRVTNEALSRSLARSLSLSLCPRYVCVFAHEQCAVE